MQRYFRKNRTAVSSVLATDLIWMLHQICRWWHGTTLQLSEQMCNALSTWGCCWGQQDILKMCRVSMSQPPQVFLMFLHFSSLRCYCFPLFTGGNISTVFGKAWRRLAKSWTVKFDPKACGALTAKFSWQGTELSWDRHEIIHAHVHQTWCLDCLARLSAHDSVE